MSAIILCVAAIAICPSGKRSEISYGHSWHWRWGWIQQSCQCGGEPEALQICSLRGSLFWKLCIGHAIEDIQNQGRAQRNYIVDSRAAVELVHGLLASSHIRTLDVKFEVHKKALQKELALAPSLVHWNEPGLAARFERIRAEAEEKQKYFRELCSALLPADSLPDAQQPQNELVQKSVAYIESNLAQQLTIKRIATELGCSERSLRMQFQDALNMGPLHFLHVRRIAHAKALIEYSYYALKEIFTMSGFQRVQHFNRVFKEVEGCTPAAWRDQYLRGIRKDVYINPRFSNQIWTQLNSKQPPA